LGASHKIELRRVLLRPSGASQIFLDLLKRTANRFLSFFLFCPFFLGKKSMTGGGGFSHDDRDKFRLLVNNPITSGGPCVSKTGASL
jgi:hypothetical protein